MRIPVSSIHGDGRLENKIYQVIIDVHGPGCALGRCKIGLIKLAWNLLWKSTYTRMTLKGDVQVLSEPVGGSKDFIAFGSGLRLCVDVDFARLQMAMFLHFLVTKYRYCTQQKVLISAAVCVCGWVGVCGGGGGGFCFHHFISFVLFSTTDWRWSVVGTWCLVLD